ncbi:hypothetical protein HNV11_14205 [Spirosoma taeanense]|uniref:Uncharacterized protein n=1 Tax=Spirosoma taeanense TaxID=2735870 RepID=A0A6M5Y935_9BACT|nr:hypothetical protein [Spirosoma taeanense]QJW90449.1 hypothetical protein HNV11_14205 [Spirosoma taeanense]
MRSLAQTAASTGSNELTVIPIEYRKKSASLQKAGFIYMNELAKKLQPILHGVITYKFQQDALL